MLRIVLAVVHLLALGVGLGAIHSRARWLRRLSGSPDALQQVLTADAWWGIAALLWIGTGIWRAVGGTEKVPTYYWHNHVFYAKMGLVALVLVLELWPMVTLLRWRTAERHGQLIVPAELAPVGRRLARVSDVQTLLVIVIVVAAVLMARGYGAAV